MARMRLASRLSARLSRGVSGFGTPLERHGGLFPGIKRLTELVVDRGAGCRLFTREGERYLDFTSGIGVLSTGHCHPTVVEAVREQAGRITHAQQSVVYNAAALDLIERLLPVLPSGINTAFFCNSGGEAVENALRLARQATRKDTVLCFLGGYHGRTSGALAVTSSSASYRGGRAGPLPSGQVFVPYPYEHAGVSADDTMRALDAAILQQVGGDDVAGVLIEPILGEGGYVVPPAGFLSRLREWCTDRGILLIADEVQSGFGRTGKMWAVDYEDVAPDILISAKGLASGYPLAAVFAREGVSKMQLANSCGGTYGGNAVACAAAMATLDVFKAEGVLKNVLERGAQLQAGLRRIGGGADGPLLADVRGRGLMVAAEFESGAAAYYGLRTSLAVAISHACFERGMLLLPTGHRDTLRFVPPLIVSEDEVDECLDIFQEAVKYVTSSAKEQSL